MTDTIESLRAQLSVANARVAELEAENADFESDIDTCTQHNVELQLQLAAQALTIKTLKQDKDLLVEAWNFGQFADDFNAPQAKPVRAALRRLCETLSLPNDATALNELTVGRTKELTAQRDAMIDAIEMVQGEWVEYDLPKDSIGYVRCEAALDAAISKEKK